MGTHSSRHFDLLEQLLEKFPHLQFFDRLIHTFDVKQ